MNSSICFNSDVGKEYKPLRDVVFIELDESPEKAGIFYIPPAYRQQISIGKVISIGKGYYHKKTGKFNSTTVKTGDYVAFDSGVLDFRVKEFEDIIGNKRNIVITGERDVQLIIKDEELIPVFDRVLIEPIKESQEKSCLFIPFSGYLDRGRVYHPGTCEQLKKGDLAKYHMRWASEIKFYDKTFISVRKSQIDCKIE